MRRQVPLSQQVYNAIFPMPTKNDPKSWSSFVKDYLVPEVRLESQLFYGDHSLEAKYPGLDYSYFPHRRRLMRQINHRSLFDTMDQLKFTSNEIKELCNWDGSLYHKQRYEREHGVLIKDTTGDETAFHTKPLGEVDYETEQDEEEYGDPNPTPANPADLPNVVRQHTSQHAPSDSSRISTGTSQRMPASIVRSGVDQMGYTAALVRS